MKRYSWDIFTYLGISIQIQGHEKISRGLRHHCSGALINLDVLISPAGITPAQAGISLARMTRRGPGTYPRGRVSRLRCFGPRRQPRFSVIRVEPDRCHARGQPESRPTSTVARSRAGGAGLGGPGPSRRHNVVVTTATRRRRRSCRDSLESSDLDMTRITARAARRRRGPPSPP